MAAMLNHLRTVCTKWAPKEITRNVANTWCDVLQEYPDEVIVKAFKEIVKTSEEWPAPAKIRRLCMGTSLTDTEIGEDISCRIEGAIRTYGGYNFKLAEAHVGEIGWEVVRQCGGWASICEITDDQLPSARKQWRDVAKVVSKRLHNNLENNAPAIPGSAKTHRLSIVGDIVGQLAKNVSGEPKMGVSAVSKDKLEF